MAITEYATPKKYSLKRDIEGNFKSVIKINHIYIYICGGCIDFASIEF